MSKVARGAISASVRLGIWPADKTTAVKVAQVYTEARGSLDFAREVILSRTFTRDLLSPKTVNDWHRLTSYVYPWLFSPKMGNEMAKILK
jgi:hypothetical protein